MRILHHLITTLDVHAPVQEIRQGVFHTAVITRHCGLAATLPRDALRQDPPLVREAGSLTLRTPAQLVQLAYSESILEAAIGMATINSLLVIEPARCQELNAADLIVAKAERKSVAIVGHFPFVPRVREKAKMLWVFEKNPWEGDVAEDQAEALIPRADVLAITGTALTNHTIEGLLALRKPGSFVLLLGDSVPLSPVLFDYGADAVCGTMVIDPQLALRCVSQGANFRQIKGTRRLTLFKP